MSKVIALRPRSWRAVVSIRWNKNARRSQWLPISAARESSSSRPSQSTGKVDETPQSALVGNGSLSRILTTEQRSLLNEVHQFSSSSRSLARELGNVPVKEDSVLGDIARLLNQRRLRQQQQQSQQQPQQKTDEFTNDSLPPSLFTVVFAGEFNSGKSTLINALLGNELLDAGVLPTTDAITITMASSDHSGGVEGTTTLLEGSSVGADAGVPALARLHLLPPSKFPFPDLCLVDTPGTNAVQSLRHTSSTLRILHDADLVVFVTSADRPFSESERELLRTSIKLYRKRAVVVINKMDVLERQRAEDHGEETKRRVVDYVMEHAGDLLGARPIVIPLSAKDALSVKLLYGPRGGSGEDGVGGDSDYDNRTSLWKRSNFRSLENFLLKTLTASSKVKTKLLNPIGVSEGILVDCQNEIERRQTELDVDVMTLRLLTSQTDAWEREQVEAIEQCQSNVREAITNKSKMARKVLQELSMSEQWKIGMGLGRGTFDRVWESGQSMQTTSKAHEGNSCQSSLEKELTSMVGKCIETLSSRAQTQGTASIEYLGKRPAVIGRSDGSGVSRMVGRVSVPKFEQLKELSAASTIRNSISNLPNDSQSKDVIYTSLRRSILLSSALLGSGAVPAALTVSGVLDAMTGMIASTSLGVLGFASLPLCNKRAARSLEGKWMEDAAPLEVAIDNLFKEALHQIRSELSESVAPYSRYVETECDWLKELSDRMETGISRANYLRSRINKTCQ